MVPVFSKDNEVIISHQAFIETVLSAAYRMFPNEVINSPDIGDLTIYDIAVRIGYLQTPKVLPQDFVYIHAGAKEGAMALYRCGLIKTKPSAIMSLQDFEILMPLKNIDRRHHHIPEFATYSMIIENFLCVKRKDLMVL